MHMTADSFTSLGSTASAVVDRLAQTRIPKELVMSDDTEIQVDNGTAQLPTVSVVHEDPVLAMIERAARDPTIEMDKFDRLMQWKEKRDAEIARRAFNVAMAAAQGEIKPVARNAENSQTSSMYATLDAIGDAIDPVIARHGFSQSFGMVDSPLPNHYRMRCTVAHADGFERDYFMDAEPDDKGPKGTVNKTSLHALGSTTSYLRRYLTLIIFNVKTKKILRDDDGNASGASLPINDEQLEQLHKALLASKSDIDKFCQLFKIEALSDLPVAKFKDAMARIAKKMESAAA